MEEDLDTSLDLVMVTKVDKDIIRNLVEKKMQSRKFKNTHGVWNCVGVVLVMPHTTIPSGIDDVASRVAQWNPTESSIANLRIQSAAPAETQGESARNRSSRRMICDWETELIKRTAGDIETAGDSVRKLLEIKGAWT